MKQAVKLFNYKTVTVRIREWVKKKSIYIYIFN